MFASLEYLDVGAIKTRDLFTNNYIELYVSIVTVSA
jgi:hypothetical protein